MLIFRDGDGFNNPHRFGPGLLAGRERPSKRITTAPRSQYRLGATVGKATRPKGRVGSERDHALPDARRRPPGAPGSSNPPPATSAFTKATSSPPKRFEATNASLQPVKKEAGRRSRSSAGTYTSNTRLTALDQDRWTTTNGSEAAGPRNHCRLSKRSARRRDHHRF